MKILFIIPGDLNLPTGGYRYDRAILEAWRSSGMDCQLISLEGNYPFPTGQEKQNALELVETFPAADIAVVDGLAGGVLPAFIEKLSSRMAVVALIHHPLCLETGLDLKEAEKLKASEAKGLEHVSRIVTTSPTTSDTVSQVFNIPPVMIETVVPGVERGTVSQGGDGKIANLICVGSASERKGHIVLFEALSQITELNWQLKCFGIVSPKNLTYQNLVDFLNHHSLEKRILLEGAVSDQALNKAYSKADLFVLPSYYEGYGMAYVEAIIRGIPVIGTTAGAIPDTVPADCGILVEPGNANALRDALATMITDKTARAKYATACRAREPEFPTWQDTAIKFASVLKKAS